MGEQTSKRHVALLIWGAMLIGVLGTAVVAVAVSGVTRMPEAEAALAGMILTAAGLVATAASWLAPRLARRSPEGSEGLALVRLVLALAMAEAACLLAAVGYMITGLGFTGVPFATGLLAFAARFPTRGTWARLGAPADGPRRMVR